MSVATILSDIGHALEKVFNVATKIAVIAEPIVDLALPGIATLYNTTVTEIVNAENAAIAAGAQNGSGAQKLAAVVAAITPAFNAAMLQNGVSSHTTTTIEAYVNAVVASLNAIPAAAPAAVIEKA